MKLSKIRDDESDLEFVAVEVWTCPTCHKRYTCKLTQEDLDDGCADGITICPDCFDERFKHITRDMVIRKLRNT